MATIIFIDIDGVLVTEQSLRADLQFLDAVTAFELYDPDCVEALNTIVRELDPEFVIHSSRRFQFSREEFSQIWEKSGVITTRLRVLDTYGQNADQWFDGPNEEKVFDIEAFITENDLDSDSYLVVEDEKLDVNNLFLVDGVKGITPGDAERIIALWRKRS
jgi:hypothetical protein